MIVRSSLVSRPSFTAFFSLEKSCEGRPGCEAKPELHEVSMLAGTYGNRLA